MRWDAALYQNEHGFVAEYGKELLEFVDRSAGQCILDVGCGTGELTAALAQNGAGVLGVDASADMIERAKARYPDLRFEVADATALTFEGCFDTVFSNAVFHWIRDQRALLAGVRRALKLGGRLVCEFGAQGNIRKIREAFSSIMARRGCAWPSPFFYPTSSEYDRLLAEAGLTPRHSLEYDRPTPLPSGRDGLRLWVTQFFSESLGAFDSETRAAILAEMEAALRPALWDGTRWMADYRRLRVVAETR